MNAASLHRLAPLAQALAPPLLAAALGLPWFLVLASPLAGVLAWRALRGWRAARVRLRRFEAELQNALPLFSASLCDCVCCY